MQRNFEKNHEIFNIMAIRLETLIFDKIFNNDKENSELKAKGFLDNVDEEKIELIKKRIPECIAQINNEHELDMSSKDIKRWSDLLTNIISPFNDHIRLEIIRCMSLTQVSFIHLWSFFGYWSRLHFRTLVVNNRKAKEMIKDQFNMLETVSEKTIDDNVRTAITEYIISQSKKLLDNCSEQELVEQWHEKWEKDESKRKKEKAILSNPYIPKRRIYLLEVMETMKYYHNPISPEISKMMLQYTEPFYFNDQSDNQKTSKQVNITPSTPLLILINDSQDIGQTKYDRIMSNIEEFKPSDFSISETNYRLAYNLSTSLMVAIVGEKNVVEKNFDRNLNWLFYLGMFDEVSTLSFFGFNISINNDAAKISDFIKHTNLPIEKQRTTEDIFNLYARNIEDFYKSLLKDKLFNFPNIDNDMAFDLMESDLRKVARIVQYKGDILKPLNDRYGIHKKIS